MTPDLCSMSKDAAWTVGSTHAPSATMKSTALLHRHPTSQRNRQRERKNSNSSGQTGTIFHSDCHIYVERILKKRRRRLPCNFVASLLRLHFLPGPGSPLNTSLESSCSNQKGPNLEHQPTEPFFFPLSSYRQTWARRSIELTGSGDMSCSFPLLHSHPIHNRTGDRWFVVPQSSLLSPIPFQSLPSQTLLDCTRPISKREVSKHTKQNFQVPHISQTNLTNTKQKRKAGCRC